MKKAMVKILSDAALAQAVGGKIHYPDSGRQNRGDKVTFVFSVGDRVEVWQTIFGNTMRGTVISRFVHEKDNRYALSRSFYPCYHVRYDNYPNSKAFCYQHHLSY